MCVYVCLCVCVGYLYLISQNKDVIGAVAPLTKWKWENLGIMNTITKLSTEQKLKEAISIRDSIKLKIIDAAIPLLAKFLIGAKSTYSDKNIAQALETQQARARMLLSELSATESSKRKKSLKNQINTVNEKIRALRVRSVDEEGMIKILREAAVEEGPFEYWIGPLISSPDSAIALFAKAVKDQIEVARIKDIDALKTMKIQEHLVV